MTTIFDYGSGDSTGLDQTAAGQIVTGLVRDDLAMTAEDRQVLRKLAERVAAIAASEKMAAVRRLWTKTNQLERTRPPIFCDPENGWNEIITERQMQCRGKLARRWEIDLRKDIFWGEVMGDDKPVGPCFNVPYTAATDDWGLQTVYHKGEGNGSYTWEGSIKDYATDLKKMHSPPVEIDWETTNGCVQIARDVLGDLLPVRLKGVWWWSLGLTWPAATFRGLQDMLCDFIEHPDELKELLSILSRGQLDKLDYLESNNLLSLNNDGTYVGSGGFGFTNELAAKFTAHVEICQDPLCQEAKKRIRAIGKHFASNTMPGGPAVVLAGTVDRFPGEYARHECRLGRKNGYGRRIDELKRFFKWFTDDRDFWVWPDEIASTEPTP